jgi:hypothetical protein
VARYKLQHCYFPFFAEQLKAFEVWLTLGSKDRDPPEQLPIVLQVRLNSTYKNVRELEKRQEYFSKLPAHFFMSYTNARDRSEKLARGCVAANFNPNGCHYNGVQHNRPAARRCC